MNKEGTNPDERYQWGFSDSEVRRECFWYQGKCYCTRCALHTDNLFKHNALYCHNRFAEKDKYSPADDDRVFCVARGIALGEAHDELPTIHLIDKTTGKNKRIPDAEITKESPWCRENLKELLVAGVAFDDLPRLRSCYFATNEDKMVFKNPHPVQQETQDKMEEKRKN